MPVGEDENVGVVGGGGSNVPIGVYISTQTTRSIINNIITITTKYINDLIHGVTSAFIKESPETVDGILFIEGEGGITIDDGWTDPLTFTKNSNGHLVVTAPDANNYSINSEGNLVYTYSEMPDSQLE